MVKVLAFTVKPVESPDARYRILQYIDPLKEQGILVNHRSLYGSRFFDWHQKPGRTVVKILTYLFFYFRRILDLLIHVRRYDVIWVGRELSPVGPPALERLLFKLGKPVVLDIDDALFQKEALNKGFVHNTLRNFKKFEAIAPGFNTIVCGNQYLADYFMQFSSRVRIIPTVVNTSHHDQVFPSSSKSVRIGWIGTPSNYDHLHILKESIEKLSRRYRIEMVLVGLNRKLDWSTDCIRYIPWELSSANDYFSEFDIGVMPLLPIEFAKGKCAFKAIQYMASGLPVVASPVGTNLDVVQDGVNGYLADSESEWQEKLSLLIENPELRKRLGTSGRKIAREQYSITAHLPGYVQIFTGTGESST
jgi:glycosyltransferase involved in cell wall biosynthesis